MLQQRKTKFTINQQYQQVTRVKMYTLCLLTPHFVCHLGWFPCEDAKCYFLWSVTSALGHVLYQSK